MHNFNKAFLIKILLVLGNIKLIFSSDASSDITSKVFGNIKDGIVAAYGDFNSDELTDVFLLRDNLKTLVILLGADSEPLLRIGHKCEYPNHEITSVVPGDFDGDALMDVMVTAKKRHSDEVLDVFINWGGSEYLNCSKEAIIETYGEPIAIDYNRDMIIDLYGSNKEGYRAFWVFNKNRDPPILQNRTADNDLRFPHANAYIDMNNDFTADLFIQTKKNFEVWYGKTNLNEGFKFGYKIDIGIIGENLGSYHIGQAVFLDMELIGLQKMILPVCFLKTCSNSTFLIYENNGFRDLHVSFKDTQGISWGFVPPKEDDVYLKTITARSGDFNMDGYPDLLVTLQTLSGTNKIQTFLLENVPCKVCIKPLKRTFEIKWNALNPMGVDTVAGAFYDFYQDGVLDVILIEKKNNVYRPLAFRNTLDYDANFVKVIVLTGLINKYNYISITPLGRKKRTYGTNYPGPRIVYFTTTQEGDIQRGSSAQLAQSAYFALQLPYTIFGLGRTPNFVDSLTVGLGNKSHTWTQLIPNSQMFVIPNPIDESPKWKAQLFVTPSKLIVMSVFALGGTCIVIMGIILFLYIKEKREDKQERLQEAHRFHFDAM